MEVECFPELVKRFTKEQKAKIPDFKTEYQTWYSEGLACISQLLPQRLGDFKGYYDEGKPRKEITFANYSIRDYLGGLQVNRVQGLSREPIVGPSAALTPFKQQVEIVRSLEKKFESSLFDIRSLLQADLFDHELDVAKELNKKGFTRGAGAVAGVVLEGHLREVASTHKVSITLKATLGALIEALKSSDVLDIPNWRFLQHLADIRNLCDHKQEKDPTKLQVDDLIDGAAKVIKTIF
jgi:hypothetical protein